MAQRLDSLASISLMDTGYLIPVSEFDVDGYNISFLDFRRNLGFIRSTGEDLTISASTDDHTITINQTTQRVGVGSFYGAKSNHDPLSLVYDFEVAGTSGNNVSSALRGSGVNQNFIFHDDVADYRLRKTAQNDFILTGSAAGFPYLLLNSGSGLFLSDGSGYDATGLDSNVDMQLYATNKMRFTLNNQTNELNTDLTYSGIQADNDFYINYNSGLNATSGSFFGLSGAVFVSHNNQNTRIGNIDTFPDARLYVTNEPTEGVTYKSFLIEDSNYPNLYFQQHDSTQDASITFNAVDSLHFGRNRAASTVSNSDGFIFNLSNKRLGIGGINPVYKLDITGGASRAQRITSDAANIITKYRSIYPVTSGPVESIFTTYTSGDNNDFIIGYDFQNEYFFYQTGNNDDTYYTARNTHKFTKSGDIDIVGSYTTNEEYCQGKFIQCYHTRCISNDIYINPFHESSHTSPNTSSNAENPFGIAPFSGKIEKIQILSADQDLSAFSNGARFEISVANASSGIDEELNSFSAPAVSAPVILPDNEVVAQFSLSAASGPGTVFDFTVFSGDTSFSAGQVIQYRIIDAGGFATNINTTIMSSFSYTIN